MQYIDLYISGKVQGVGFRYHSFWAARKYGITGFVKNLPNGDVFIHAEGKNNNMHEFIASCRKGPPFARVNNISIEDSKPDNCKRFEIRR